MLHESLCRVQDAIAFARKLLNGKKALFPSYTAEELAAHCFAIPRSEVLFFGTQPISPSERSLFLQKLQMCLEGQPFAYVLGEVSFYGCTLQITPDVLIPRPETEILVDKVASFIRSQNKSLRIWDLCCGSGCIGLSLLKAFPTSFLTLSDICPYALKVAEANAKKNRLFNHVEFLLGDLLDPFEGKGTADILVCNPPYLSKKEYKDLEPSVRNFEPEKALVGGEEGDEFYTRLAKRAFPFLAKGGVLFLEIGWLQGKKVQEAFIEASWENVQILKDWSQKDRFCIVS